MWINYKPTNGKMLRIYLEKNFDNQNIKTINITGDFFYFPNEGLEELEHFLIGKTICSGLGEKIDEFLSNNDHKVLGFKGEDIEKALLTEVFENE